MTMKHTPGPWSVSKHATPDYAPQFGIYAGDSPNDLAIVKGDNAEADAALIEAAPDLLAALQEAMPFLRWAASRREDAYPAIDNALAAIETALGE